MWCYLCWGVALYLVYRVIVFFVSDCDFAVRNATVDATYLTGKSIVVTGASSGLGEKMAIELCKFPIARIVLSARREPELQRVRGVCAAVAKQHGHQPAIVVQTLDQLAFDTHKAYAESASDGQPVDIVVLNAGRSSRGTLEDTKLEIYRGLLELNVVGVVSLTQVFLPHLRKSGGQFVVTGSVAGKMAAPLQGPYAMSKFAITAFCDTLRSEVAADGHFVTHICPGPVYSEGANNAFSTQVDKKVVQESKNAKKMDADRFAERAVSAISNRIDEAWIGMHPILMMVYLHQYFPTAARFLMKKFGGRRVAAFKSGVDLNEIPFSHYVKGLFVSKRKTD